MCHRAASLQKNTHSLVRDISCTVVWGAQYSLIVSSLFTNTAAVECLIRVLLPSSFSEALLLISTSTYIEQPRFSRVNSALFCSFQIKLLNVLRFLLVRCPSHIPLLKNNNYLWASFHSSLIWFLLTEHLLVVIQYNIILSSCEFTTLWRSLFMALIWACRFMFVQLPLKRNSDQWKIYIIKKKSVTFFEGLQIARRLSLQFYLSMAATLAS